MDPFHLLLNHGANEINFILWDLKKKLIMDLEDHFCSEIFLSYSIMDINHGLLNQICCCALDGCIDGHAFGLRSGPLFAVINLGQVPPPVEKGRHIPLFPGQIDHLFPVFRHTFVSLVVSLNMVFGPFIVYPQFLSQSLRAHAVNDAKVNGLGNTSHICGDRFSWHA